MVLAARAQIQAVDPNQVLVRGYAAVFGNQFSYFDPYEWRERRMTVDPGAFAAVLAQGNGRPLPVYWSHGIMGLQLGETTRLHEDARGLYFEARPFATAEVIDQLTVLHGRSRTGASMLFDFGELAEDDDGVEHITEVSSLYEVGPTPEGANPEAYAEIVPIDAAAPVEPDVNDAALAAAIVRASARIRRF